MTTGDPNSKSVEFHQDKHSDQFSNPLNVASRPKLIPKVTKIRTHQSLHQDKHSDRFSSQMNKKCGAPIGISLIRPNDIVYDLKVTKVKNHPSLQQNKHYD